MRTHPAFVEFWPKTWTQIAAILCAFLLPCAESAAAQQGNSTDARQANDLMAFGPHMLTGRAGATRNSLPINDAKGRKKKRRSRTERVHAADEVVYLIPWTEKVAAAIAKGNGNIALTRVYLITEGGEATRLNARTFTRENGIFRFRGLKPGRYVLLTEVPYKAAVTIRSDTGRTRTETSTQGFPVFQGGQQIGFVPTSSTSVTSPIYRYDKAVSDLRHYILKVVDVRSDVSVTDLGDVE
jgi:hypothetical protein